MPWPARLIAIVLAVLYVVDAQAVSSLLAGLVVLAIGASVLLRDRTRRTYTSFAAFTFMVAAWHLATYIALATKSELVAWLAYWPAASIPPTAVSFFREFLAQPSIGGTPRPPRVTLAWTFLAYLALVYSAISGQRLHTQLWFQLPFGAYVFAGLYRCVLDLFLQYRKTANQVAKTRIFYLLIGGFVSTTLALTDVLPRFGITWPTIGNVLTILYLYFISQALFRHRLIDVQELLGKMAVLGTLVVLLWATYGVLLTWVGGERDGLFLLNAIVASFVILILFEPIRSRLENGINRWLVRQRSALRGRIHRLLAEMQGVVDTRQMTSKIIHALEESRRATHASLYLLDSTGTKFERQGYLGTEPSESMDAPVVRHFLDRLNDGHLDRFSLTRELTKMEAGDADATGNKEPLSNLIDELERAHTDVVIPILGTAEATEESAWLLGLLLVRDERTNDAFDEDDIRLLRQISAQAGSIVESSRVYEKVKERERLAAIGAMSAGLAHEIRNPLGAIKGAAQLLLNPDGTPADPTPESGEFLNIIVEEVNRLNKVVTQFLDYAKLAKSETQEYEAVDLNEVIAFTIQLLEKNENAEPIQINLKQDELLPHISGDKEALRQVFLNLGLNAFHAMPEGGTLEVLTSRRRRSRLGYGSFAEVRFRDFGKGIAPEVLEKLFIPFFTTKEGGTGLGLAISQRIISQHGGTIEVHSRVGKGSTFSVFLPAIPSPAAAKSTQELLADKVGEIIASSE